jgi:hypothetical protein
MRDSRSAMSLRSQFLAEELDGPARSGPRYRNRVELPAYWLVQPGPPPDAETESAFDRLLDEALERGPGHAIDYRLAAPRWQFLCHAARHGWLLHGSGEADIDRFDPRQPADQSAFGGRRAVFAAADGIWPIYFAILDRDRHPMVLVNSCISLSGPDGQTVGPYYFFSITATALEQEPWREGMVYLLPAAGFEAQPPIMIGETAVYVAQAANPAPVRPLAKLTIRPTDFPFLRQIRGHDDGVIYAKATADPDGFP